MKTGLFNLSGSLGLCFGFGAIVLVACASNEPFDPAGVKVAVDSAVYHLRPMQGNAWYEINLTFTILNTKTEDVYLSRSCGSWSLRRADDADKTDLMLGEYACAAIGSFGPLSPITLHPGEQFSQSFRLTGSNSPLTRPPITIENNTGTLVFTWWLTDPEGRQTVGLARSAPFRVEPPGA